MKKHAIATAVIRNGNDFLIAKRAPQKKFAPNQWEFISGFVEATESSEATILRELEEELGVSGRIVGKSGAFKIIDEEGEWMVKPFLMELDSLHIKMNHDDHSEVRWVQANDLDKYPDLRPFLDDAGFRGLVFT